MCSRVPAHADVPQLISARTCATTAGHLWPQQQRRTSVARQAPVEATPHGQQGSRVLLAAGLGGGRRGAGPRRGRATRRRWRPVGCLRGWGRRRRLRGGGRGRGGGSLPLLASFFQELGAFTCRRCNNFLKPVGRVPLLQQAARAAHRRRGGRPCLLGGHDACEQRGDQGEVRHRPWPGFCAAQATAQVGAPALGRMPRGGRPPRPTREPHPASWPPAAAPVPCALGLEGGVSRQQRCSHNGEEPSPPLAKGEGLHLRPLDHAESAVIDGVLEAASASVQLPKP